MAVAGSNSHTQASSVVKATESSVLLTMEFTQGY
jgi:hypothetical protein